MGEPFEQARSAIGPLHVDPTGPLGVPQPRGCRVDYIRKDWQGEFLRPGKPGVSLDRGLVRMNCGSTAKLDQALKI
ncbi:hypothetical protein C8T65DRAFT_659679, partial [Cerioporus squamosus]